MPILAPIYAIHHDPEIYPDPEKFDPERWAVKGIPIFSPSSFKATFLLLSFLSYAENWIQYPNLVRFPVILL